VAAFMVARRSWTTALRRRWPWRLNLKLGRASTNPGKPSAQDYAKKGGLRLSSHGDGRGDDAPARSARRNDLPNVARGNDCGRGVMVGSRRSYYGDNWAMRRELVLAMATAEVGKCSAAAAVLRPVKEGAEK